MQTYKLFRILTLILLISIIVISGLFYFNFMDGKIFGYHLNNPGEPSPREAIRSWKRHVYPLTWCAEMSMDGEGYVPKLPRKRQIPRRKPRGTCRVVVC